MPGFVGRMSIAMFGIGIVLLLSAVTGSYALAGAVAATFALAQAFCSPLLGRAVDRLGQRRVVVPLVGVHAGALLLLLAAAETDAPSWTFFATAALSGAALPSVGSLVRARWSHLLGGTGTLQPAYALESVADEVVFVVGPVLVTFLATGVTRTAGLLAAVVLTVTGSLVLAAHRRSEPPSDTGAGGVARAWGVHARGVTAVALVFGAAGSLFGAVEVTVVAFADTVGSRSDAGWVLALLAGGSMLSGLAYGLRTWRTPLGRRFAVGAVALALGTASLPFASSVGVLAVEVFVTGLAISPTLIPGFALVERHAPPGGLTEALSWVNTALGVGLAVGSSLAGRAVDVTGAQQAFLVTAISGVAVALLAVLAQPALQEAAPVRDGPEHA